MWESEQGHPNYHQYECVIPLIEGCTVKRCLPNISLDGGHHCTTSSSCPDGQICSLSELKCIQCDETQDYARGACHQIKTSGAGGTPAFAANESGCAGDHCKHVCAYDTMCVRILDQNMGMDEIDVTATHNQLPGLLNLMDTDLREVLMRPSTCGGEDAGSVTGGMRCAADIHRTVTSKQRTPDVIRDRRLNVVEMAIQNWEDWVSFDEEELKTRAVMDEGNGWGVYIGYDVPNTVLEVTSGTEISLGSGADGFGLTSWHWGKKGVVQCDVKYSQNEPLHQIWGNINPDLSLTRSTLLTRACIRWEGLSDEQKWCAEWGTTSDFGSTLPFGVTCTLNGPQVSNIVPTGEQRLLIENNLHSAFETGLLSTSELLRASFHDASTYNNDELEVRGGPQVCMRFEHVHGNSANRGLAFFIDHLPEGSGCDFRKNGNCPFSVADLLQYAGGVAVEHAGGPTFSSDLKWGRTDAPYIFCLGELQLNMPDAKGGHHEGAMHVGSSDIQGRLEIVLNSTTAYFEEQLGLSKEEWVAFLGGGHSIGGVKGLITARNTRFNFDSTVETFDNLYFQRLSLAKDSNWMSLCPQMKSMGDSHFWEPGEEWEQNGDHWQVLIDTDVSTTVNESSMEIVRLYAEDEELFFNAFVSAFQKVSELGYGDENLHDLPDERETLEPLASSTRFVIPMKEYS